MDKRKKKKYIINIITGLFVLAYIALFFIHVIQDRGVIKQGDTGKTVENNVIDGNNNIDNNINNNNTNNNIPKNNNRINSNLINNIENVTNNNQTSENKPGSNTGGDSGNKPGGDSGDNTGGEVVETNDRFKVLENSSQWNELKQLSVFNNKYFNDKSIIAPGVSGKYNFTVENYTGKDFIYGISFTEENPLNINLKYKLKLNGNYIVGNENEWISTSDLNVKDLLINTSASDLYTLEWKWIDSSNDTQIGINGSDGYKLNIKVTGVEK